MTTQRTKASFHGRLHLSCLTSTSSVLLNRPPFCNLHSLLKSLSNFLQYDIYRVGTDWLIKIWHSNAHMIKHDVYCMNAHTGKLSFIFINHICLSSKILMEFSTWGQCSNGLGWIMHSLNGRGHDNAQAKGECNIHPRPLLHCPSALTNPQNWYLNNLMLLAYLKQPLVFEKCTLSR